MSETEHQQERAETPKPPGGEEITKELTDILKDRQQREAAWDQYRGYDDAFKQTDAKERPKALLQSNGTLKLLL